jgi:predicted transcriptional regulator
VSHAVQLSDETYQTIADLAQARGTTPEEMAEQLLRERLAERAAIARQNAEWSVGLDEELARAARGENARQETLEEFFAALEAVPPDPDVGAGE